MEEKIAIIIFCFLDTYLATDAFLSTFPLVESLKDYIHFYYHHGIYQISTSSDVCAVTDLPVVFLVI